ncbi:MAG: phage tail sheath subtilisin-like domain-containing protein [Flavobacterium sp.]|uniref:phage tail sheath subtilisin-like domain-containing protein n=1 Tax=Flavobacterium sp. TaxID=239 RepID=UPI0026091ACE|nr:phage tail sheath subtilisin-like domain-containing protein [Flavobacterium sp.]MDD5150603.1 phage tail sheath subtilisin-like domain-containing protein [Flavobacterium sp.]
MATNLLSPGTEVREIDLSEVIQQEPISAGAFVGQFTWGPVGVPTRIFNTDELESFFGAPTNGKFNTVDNRIDWYSAANFLDYSKNLKIVREIAAGGHCANAVANYSGTKIVVKNQADFITKFNDGAATPDYNNIEFVARYPGKRGNSLRVSIADFNTFDSWAYKKYFSNKPGTSAYAKSRGVENDEVHVIVIDEDGVFNKSKTKGYILEKFAFKSKAIDAKDSQNKLLFFGTVINTESKYIRYFSQPNTSYFSNSDRITDVYIVADVAKTNSQNDYFNQNGVWVTVDNTGTNGTDLQVVPVFGQSTSKIVDLNITASSGYSPSDTIVFSEPSIKGELIVDGTGAITGILIKSYGSLPAVGTVITSTITGAATTETGEVKFLNQTSGKTITLAGLTATIGTSGATDAEIATAFISGLSSANVTISGTLTGWTVSAGSDTTRALFTSTTANTNVADLAKTGTGTIGGITKVQGNAGTGSGGVVSGTVVSGDNKIIGFNITNYGKGYTSAPTITVHSHEGYATEVSGIVHLESKNFSVRRLVITNPGLSYSVGDIITISDPSNGVPATAFVNSVGVSGNILSVSIANPGSGFVKVPTAVVKSTAGTGAQITVELTTTNINEASFGTDDWGNTVRYLGLDGTEKPSKFKRLLKQYDVRLTTGKDDYVNERLTTNDLIIGWDRLKDASIDDSSLMFLGDASAELANHVIDNIAEFRKDCVVFVSPPLSAVNDKNQADARTAIVNFRNLLGTSSYAFMDSGWKLQRDTYNNTYIWVPLNADMAGLCARVDQTNESWYSPAGVTRGQILNVVSLAFNPDQDSRDLLYQNNVNPIISVKGEGTYLFGDLTLQVKDSAFKWINVRRLFLELEKTIKVSSKQQTFEFNDIFTRTRFVSFNEPYLRSVQGRRGVYSYKIVCDESNNTPDVIDRGEFVASIYVEPARSINFITLNFVATRTGSVGLTEIESIS